MVALGTACGSDDPPDIEPNEAAFRAMHLVSGIEDLEVRFNQSPNPVLDEVDPFDSTGYETVTAGTYTVDVLRQDEAISNSLATLQVTLQDQGAYTLVISGSEGNITTDLYEDMFDIPDEEIFVRLFNYADNIGPITLYFLPDSGEPQPLFAAVEFGAAGAVVTLQDGNHDIAADLDNDGALDAQYDLPPLSDGTLANFFAVWDVDDGETDLILQLNNGVTFRLDPESIDPMGPRGVVRAINLVDGAGALTFFAGENQFAEGVGAMMSSEYASVPAGTYDVGIGTSANNLAITLEDVEIEENEAKTVVAFGTANAARGEVIDDDRSDIGDDQTRVRFMHAADGAPQSDVFLFNGTDFELLVEDLDFGEVSDAEMIDAGMRRIALDLTNDEVIDVVFDTPMLDAAANANVFITFNADGDPALLIQHEGRVEMDVGMMMP